MTVIAANLNGPLSPEVELPNGKPIGNLPDLDASKLIFTPSVNLKAIPDQDDLVFGKHTTDHMLVATFDPQTGWSAPEIKPYGPFLLDPTSSCIQYCTNAFEGMKAYFGPNGEPLLFRPQRNMTRLKSSVARAALPSFDTDALLELIKRLVMIERRWVPQSPGCSLYIRPTVIGTRASLGVAASDHAMLYVILSPTGPYFKTGEKPLSLLAYGKSARTWPNGTGNFKLGINYPSAFQAQEEAHKQGYAQILWLVRDENSKPETAKVTEAGSMNFFIVLQRDDGDLDAITPPLNGTILPGLTRDACLDLLATHTSKSPLQDLSPSVRVHIHEVPFSIGDLYTWSSQNRLLEAFGVGTAVIVTSVGIIGYEGKPDILLPEYSGKMGPVAKALYGRLTDIQDGRAQYKDWSVPCC